MTARHPGGRPPKPEAERKVPLSISADAVLLPALDARASNRSVAARRIFDRYFDVVATHRPALTEDEWLAVVDALWAMPRDYARTPGATARDELVDALRFVSEDADGDDLIDGDAGWGDGMAGNLLGRAKRLSQAEAVAVLDVADLVLVRGGDRRRALRDVLGTDASRGDEAKPA